MVTFKQLKNMSVEKEVTIFYAHINKWYTGRIMSSKELEIASQAFEANNIDYVNIILDLEEGILLHDIFNNLEAIVTDYEKNELKGEE